MKRTIIIISTIATIFSAFACRPEERGQTTGLPDEPQINIEPALPEAKKKMQVVFTLDATGSMAGLIRTAKEKIWSIASSMAQADSADLEIGLIFYRDRGDDFITKVIPLSKDLDDIYEQLMGIQAAGGGDAPESVNQGLYEAITLMQWSADTNHYKTIFLVGDCPPHMDYKDDVKYPESCKLAKQRGIFLNTILMGNDRLASRIWQEIAQCGDGSYLQVGMDANNLEVRTHYDEEIHQVQQELDKSRIYYGDQKMKEKQYMKESQSSKLNSNMSTSSAARRAEYNTTKVGKEAYYGSNELLKDHKEGKVRLEDLKAEELPAEIATLPEQQRKAYLENKVAQRDSLEQKMQALLKLREAHIQEELKKKKASEVENSFDNQVYEKIKDQAEKKNIKMNGDVKY